MKLAIKTFTDKNYRSTETSPQISAHIREVLHHAACMGFMPVNGTQRINSEQSGHTLFRLTERLAITEIRDTSVEKQEYITLSVAVLHDCARNQVMMKSSNTFSTIQF